MHTCSHLRISMSNQLDDTPDPFPCSSALNLAPYRFNDSYVVIPIAFAGTEYPTLTPTPLMNAFAPPCFHRCFATSLTVPSLLSAKP